MAYTPEQQHVIDMILKIGRRRGASKKEIKAALETGAVESNFRNLPGGDADSQGWRQERASIYKDPRNLKASINRFFNETDAVQNQYRRAGDLAAAVQRPAEQYRGRYQENAGVAQAILKGFRGGGGGGAAPARAGGGAGGMVPGFAARDFSTTTQQFDQAAFEKARKLSILGSYLAKHDPENPLVRLGIVSNAPVDPSQFTSSVTQQHHIAGSPDVNVPGGAGGGGRGGGGRPRHLGKRLAHPGQLLELIHKDAHGSGYAVKDGHVVSGPGVYGAVWDGHANHVHVAADPHVIVALGHAAQKMGLHVGENPHFGGVNPVHAKNSYHYRGMAIDVSGDPRLMDKFSRFVEGVFHPH